MGEKTTLTLACVLRTEPRHKFLYHKFPREGSCLLPLAPIAEQHPHISRPAVGRAGTGYLGSSTFLLKGKYREGIFVLIGLIAFIWEAMRRVDWKMKSTCRESSDDLLCLLNRVRACAHLWMFIIFPRAPHTDYVCVLFFMRSFPTPLPGACSVPFANMSLEGEHCAVSCPQQGEVAAAP